MPDRPTRSTRNQVSPARSLSSAFTSSTESINSTNTTRSPSPTPFHSPSHTSILNSTLRRRLSHSTPDAMFTSRKYTPLPTSSNQQQRRRAGGLTAWKRWALIGTTISILLLLGVSLATKHKSEEVWDTTETYTPDLDSKPAQGVDETDYSSPPFRPSKVPVGTPDDGEVEDDEVMRIKPIGDFTSNITEDPEDDEDYPATKTSPHDPNAEAAKVAHEADPDFSDLDEELEEGEEGQSAKEEANSKGLPTSFENDPDPSGSVSCSKPHSPTKPIVQYALTIDAGSTGSRIHVYKFNNCGPSPALEYETFKSINPGLSAYPRDPTAAAASLDALLEEAQRVVPKSMWNCSPVEVKATAGLRLLGPDQSQAILDEVRNRLETKYKFVVASEGSVEIMEGKDEGVYAWITANYLLNKIGEGSSSEDTLAVMDLGGASTQIVFEPRFPAKTGNLAEGEHKYSLKFGGKEFTLYQHSYLGYGLMMARRSVHNLVAFTWSFGRGEVEWDDLDEEIVVQNPCLSYGTTRRVELDPKGRKSVNVTMHGGNGKFEACSKFVELVMAKDAICEVKPCSFDGVYQPSLLDTFPKGQFLALSYFTDRIKPLLSSKTISTLTISQLKSIAQDVCAGPASWSKRWGNQPEAMAELEDRPEYCLDLTFMHALLGLGYELADDRQLMVEKKLRGVELGWALGAGLALVQNAKLTCTA